LCGTGSTAAVCGKILGSQTHHVQTPSLEDRVGSAVRSRSRTDWHRAFEDGRCAHGIEKHRGLDAVQFKRSSAEYLAPGLLDASNVDLTLFNGRSRCEGRRGWRASTDPVHQSGKE